VPINFTVSKLVKMDKQPISLTAGLRYWAESPDNGPDGFGARVGITFSVSKMTRSNSMADVGVVMVSLTLSSHCRTRGIFAGRFRSWICSLECPWTLSLPDAKKTRFVFPTRWTSPTRRKP
jgi:hypothetical protein